MSTEEKENILKTIIEETDCLDDGDKSSVIAYIRGTRDTRERINMENKERK